MAHATFRYKRANYAASVCSRRRASAHRGDSSHGERLLQLRLAINSGAYLVDAHRIAGKLLKRS